MRAVSHPSSVVAVTTNTGRLSVKSARVRFPSATANPRSRPGSVDLADVSLGGERVQDDAVCDLARDLGHLVADRGQHRPAAARTGSVPGSKNGVINVCV